MKLSAPTQPIWIIAIVVGVLGMLAKLLPIADLAPYSFWMVAVAFVMLSLATMLKGV